MGRGHGCVNANFDGTNYASPMPLIGLYTAGATLVCLLFMILDILAAYRVKKIWFPCQFFSLNSVTLTLLSVVAKLSLDLTTTMPSVEDQLSKLTSTTLICISIGFFLPSLGSNSHSECFTNVAALSILVVTIIVDVCIQLHTGVIILFRVQHIFILCFLISLLMIFWFYALDINKKKEFSLDYMKRNFANGEKSMLHRLNLSYMYGYGSNPQFVLCKDSAYATACMICAFCSFLLFHSLASVGVGFCEEVSDYKWSMKILVLSQIITIAVGTFVTTLRLLTMFLQVTKSDIIQILHDQAMEVEHIIVQNPVVRHISLNFCVVLLKVLLRFGVALIETCVLLPSLGVMGLIGVLLNFYLPEEKDHEAIQEFKALVYAGERLDLDEWTLKRGIRDMMKWVELVNQTKPSLNNVFKLLSGTTTTTTFQEYSLMNLLKDKYDLMRSRRFVISSLSIVLLVKLAIVAIPFSLSGSLFNSLSEVFEVIHFVDRKMCPLDSVNKMRSKLAKVMWFGHSFSVFLPKSYEKSANVEASVSQAQLEQAIEIIKSLKKPLPADLVWDELGAISDFILEHRVYESVEELYGFMEQLFVDMLHEILIQLPNAIYKDIIESSPEDFEERVKSALEALLRIEQLDGLVQWSFPVGTSMTSLIAGDVPISMNNESTTPSLQSSSGTATDVAHRMGSDSLDHHCVQMSAQEEIIQVE